MHPDLEKLLQLQEADREIRRLNDQIAALPKRVAAIEAKLADEKHKVEKARAAIKTDDAARRRYEGEIQGLQQKISKYREQSLAVKTNEQYRALLHEIQFAEQEIRRCEDKILEGMLDSEANEGVLKRAEVELKSATAEIEKEKAEARVRTEADQKQLDHWQGRRKELRSGLPEPLLRHYDRVLKLRGSAIAEARQGKCLACQVMLRPQVYNDVCSGSEMVTCDSCQRLLYHDPSREPASEAPKTTRKIKPGRPDERAWYYLPDSAGEGVFAALMNRMRDCSLRRYSAETGQLLAAPVYRDGDFQNAFSQELAAGMWLFEQIEGQDLENWEQLPPEILSILKREVRIIQVATEQAPATH